MLNKKIIHQLSLSQIGGVQRSFDLYLKYALKKSRFHHCIYSFHEVLENFTHVRKHHYNMNRSLYYKLKFIFYLYSKKHIVHFYNNLGSNNVSKLLKFLPSSNIIFHERGRVWNARDEDEIIYKNNTLKAKIIIANSKASKIMLEKRFNIDPKKIKVIYNGLLSQSSCYKIRNNQRFSKKFSVGYLGRLDTPKGTHVLIESAKKLTDYDFFIAGNGPWNNILRSISKGSNNIHFMGAIKEPLEFISKMDTIVVPSIREPLGNSIIEAGFCKKPVIASNIDGIAEIIKNGVNGILIDPTKGLTFKKLPKGAVVIPKFVVNPKTYDLQKPMEIDPIKLCESIVKLKNNPKLRQKYGELLYQTVKQKFCIEGYFKKLENIYQNIKLN